MGWVVGRVLCSKGLPGVFQETDVNLQGLYFLRPAQTFNDLLESFVGMLLIMECVNYGS